MKNSEEITNIIDCNDILLLHTNKKSTKKMSVKLFQSFRKKIRNTSLVLFIFLSLLIPMQCEERQGVNNNDDSKKLVNTNHCHTCIPNTSDKIKLNINNRITNKTHDILDGIVSKLDLLDEKYLIKLANKNESEIEEEVLKYFDKTFSMDFYEIIDGVEIRPSLRNVSMVRRVDEDFDGRAITSLGFSTKFMRKLKHFAENHVLSISLPKTARFFGFRSFGLKKLLLPILIGVQVLKSALIFMFLPSIIGSFGKMVGKGLSQLSAASSQASYPPMNMEDQDPYSANANKDIMGYETEPEGVYTYPQDEHEYTQPNEVNELSDGTLSRFGPGGAKVTFVPTKNGEYYRQKAQTTDYKVFHKIPASSMILSNYDPFYSPILSRLDGIFARLDLAPRNVYTNEQRIGGQTLSQIKLESCREQLICLMYSNPAKYAPYSNLVSAQLSREITELRRPSSDNPEILRFFRYMRAARQGQEGSDCISTHPACDKITTPAHTMIHAYQDINKLVSARKLKN